MKTILISALLIALAAPGVQAQTTSKTMSTQTVGSVAVTSDYGSPQTVTSVALPTGYKSKKNSLVVTTSFQEKCGSDDLGTSVSVAGNQLQPDPGAFYYFECLSDGNYHFVTRQWTLASEALGGPAIAAGSTVDVKAGSNGGTSMISLGNVTVLSVK